MFDFIKNFQFATKKEAIQYGAIFLLERNLITDPGILFENAFWKWCILADEEEVYDLETVNRDDEYYRVHAVRADDMWRISIKNITSQDGDSDTL